MADFISVSFYDLFHEHAHVLAGAGFAQAEGADGLLAWRRA